jgi:hypothetical protein
MVLESQESPYCIYVETAQYGQGIDGNHASGLAFNANFGEGKKNPVSYSCLNNEYYYAIAPSLIVSSSLSLFLSQSRRESALPCTITAS